MQKGPGGAMSRRGQVGFRSFDLSNYSYAHVNFTGPQDEEIMANLHFTDWKVSIDKKLPGSVKVL